jgi:hypothetical protein
MYVLRTSSLTAFVCLTLLKCNKSFTLFFQSLVAKLRSEVQYQGYLHKTGSNMKGKFILTHQSSFELRHDKTNIVRLRPAWIQTSLRIRAV